MPTLNVFVFFASQVSDCENIGGHSLDISIKVKEDSDAKEGVVELYKSDCSGYLSQVSSVMRAPSSHPEGITLGVGKANDIVTSK